MKSSFLQAYHELLARSCMRRAQFDLERRQAAGGAAVVRGEILYGGASRDRSFVPFTLTRAWWRHWLFSRTC
jgi:hypothetical protein